MPIPLRGSKQWAFNHTLQQTGKVFQCQGYDPRLLPRTVHHHDMIAGSWAS